MATDQLEPHLAPNVEQLLSSLRRRIRGYTWLRGLAIVALTVALLFWVLVAIDWFFEPEREVRLGMLVVASLAAAIVAWQFVFSRVFVPLPDRSLAVVLERQFGRFFNESLVTAVELSSDPSQISAEGREMLAHTCADAAQRADDVDLNSVFDFAPLAASLLGALLLVGSVVVFAAEDPHDFAIAAARLSTVSDAAWPRKTRLVVAGFPERDGVREAVVARGGDLTLIVNADTTKVVPSLVQLRYRTEEGLSERKPMIREGNATPGRDPYQRFEYTFQGVISPLEFEVRGGDARVRNLRIRVVDSPSITATIACTFPAYTSLAPRTLPGTAMLPLPRGTQLVIEAVANKPLRQAWVERQIRDQPSERNAIPVIGPSQNARRLRYTIDRVDVDTVLAFTLLDTDGIRNREPIRIDFTAVPDAAPQVNVRLRGIGTAITALARLPFVGEIKDDYGVTEVWAEYAIDGGTAQPQPFAQQPIGQTMWQLDQTLDAAMWKLKPGQKLVVGAQAADNYHAPDHPEPNIGLGERFMLDVVTPEELRGLLETREMNLRQRFESILTEVTETRDSLSPLEIDEPPARPEKAGQSPASAPDRVEPDEAPADALDQSPAARLERSQLRIERASQNSQKNAEETAGIASSFDGIREELINNRVDTEELRVRLKDQIAEPLHSMVGRMFPELETRLKALSARLEAEKSIRGQARQAALTQADAIVVEMQKIRDRMLEMETFNEVIEELRAIMAAQHNVMEETKKQRSKSVRKLLED